jgi:hypothetical protein
MRAVRLMDLLDNIPQFEVIFATLARLVPQFSVIIGVLICTFYVYAAIGIQVFGGLIDTSTLSSSGDPTFWSGAYSSSLYWVFNFNDFGSSLVMLFILLVGNNWNIFQEAFVYLTNDAARIYFISFYLFAVLVIMNLVVALILDAFVKEMNHPVDPNAEAANVLSEGEENALRGKPLAESPAGPTGDGKPEPEPFLVVTP